MLKRLLTFLAIITGLTAVGAPVHVSAAGTLGVALEQSQRADQPAKDDIATCEERQRKARGEKTRPCRPASTVTVVIPTVMFGPDRAFE